MKLRILPLVAVALIAVLLAGCGGDNSPKGGGGGRGNGTWTVLVYLNADNDLEPYGILNLNQMEKIGSTDSVKIAVQMDRSPGYDTSNGNWVGCRRYLVTRDGDTSIIHSQLLQDMGSTDMGSTETLRDFIQWGQHEYPADHYCLVIWNHGSGWRSAKSMSVTSRNISFDDTSGTSIRTSDLPYALAAASPQFDLVAMDASLMQMLEVAYEVRNSAKLLVGSEESPPGDGYVYDKWLGPLATSPGMAPGELGTLIAQQYVNAYVNRYDVTQSVIDLSKMEGVASATNDLAAAIMPHMTTDAAALKTARRNAQSYAFDFYKDLVDYAGLVNQLVPDPAIASANSRLHTALSSAILFEGHTGSTVDRSHGLSIYMPEPVDYLSRYETLSFCTDYPNWAQLIKSQKE